MWEVIFTNAAAVIWLILAVIFVIAEAFTATLTSVWFAAGSILAMVISLFGGAFWLQLLVFIASSGILVLITKPLSEKLINRRAEKTNADRVVGESAIVTQTIDNQASQGQVRVLEQLWTARSANGLPISEGTLVTVKEIQGVKLLVEPMQQDIEKEEI